jgi:transcriptional regulator with XRE-family HTH domain
MSQEQLASKADISTQYVSNIERGKENPTLDLLLKLADALKVQPVDLFDFEAEGLDQKALQTELRRLAETPDIERLRMAIRILRAVLH